jgi:hypothetical protein
MMLPLFKNGLYRARGVQVAARYVSLLPDRNSPCSLQYVISTLLRQPKKPILLAGLR